MALPLAPTGLALALLLPALVLDQCIWQNGNQALGILARERVALTATANETVVDLPVAEGSKVSRGDVLVRLDDRIQLAQVERSKAELARAQANLEKLRTGARPEEITIARSRVAGAQATLTEAQDDYERNRILAERDTISEARLLRDLARRDQAQAELDGAREQLQELINGARPEDIRIAEAELAAAKATVNAEERRLEDLVVTASRDGMLDSLPWNLGERVTIGSPVAIILAGAVPYARVYVPEPFRASIKEGDRLEVRVDGIDAPFEGTVRWISLEPAFTPYYALNQEDRSRLMYLAEIDLPESAADLPVGMPAQAIMP
ncbi:HlyD family secretion protein [Oceanomicrobium pacificus]|uniref:HlyD family efflux transporter periplasmic adaptor subunit n=1 Tax=Oceanomicrobium pacificus TaxID=2692916 RepID=A0A6B0TRE4_9RHOB|nr:HlyD family efflux transporter periplasmic adaptor subunit [Oceanomicrobium pacificus]MXU64308.1 HlyD family efflux transporter periplasmic adaptor subunit [Oceanomicrobium pacificus]